MSSGPPGDQLSAEEREKAAIKEELLQWWIRAKGNPDDFEQAFPQLYERELQKRAREKTERLFRDH